MWILGLQQGSMWKAISPEDGSLTYTFMESVLANYPYWKMRTLGGLLFFIGLCFFAYNIIMTVVKSKSSPVQASEGR
jgi:cytochrome c oxidase cbb3-type subunit 1